MGLLGGIGKTIGGAAGGILNDVTGGSLGDFIPGVGDARAQEAANRQNVILQKQNRDWMERMSNTAYQRAMADMGKAGLNPILAYQQGGASVPTSTAPVVNAAPKTALVDAAVQGFTGISAARAQTQQATTAQATGESTVALNAAQSAKAVADTEKSIAETKKTIDSIQNQKVRRELEKAQIPLAKVKESAAALAKKGADTISNFTDKLFRSSAKPIDQDANAKKRYEYLLEQTKPLRKQKD